MKQETMIILVVVGILLVGSMGLFATSGFGDYQVSESCEYVSTNFLKNAKQGECFVSTINSRDRVAYIKTMDETTRTGPSGEELFCKVDSCTSCWDNIYTCDLAYDDRGLETEVCQYDADCESDNCVNALCVDGPKRTCGDTGDKRCFTNSNFQQCLSSGQWSGLLTCPSGTTCYLGECKEIQELEPEPLPTTFSTPEPDDPTPAPQSLPDNVEDEVEGLIDTCAEVCSTLFHEECAGEWKVSGDFSSCSCVWECEDTELNIGGIRDLKLDTVLFTIEGFEVEVWMLVGAAVLILILLVIL